MRLDNAPLIKDDTWERDIKINYATRIPKTGLQALS